MQVRLTIVAACLFLEDEDEANDLLTEVMILDAVLLDDRGVADELLCTDDDDEDANITSEVI